MCCTCVLVFPHIQVYFDFIWRNSILNLVFQLSQHSYREVELKNVSFFASVMVVVHFWEPFSYWMILISKQDFKKVISIILIQMLSSGHNIKQLMVYHEGCNKKSIHAVDALEYFSPFKNNIDLLNSFFDIKGFYFILHCFLAILECINGVTIV